MRIKIISILIVLFTQGCINSNNSNEYKPSDSSLVNNEVDWGSLKSEPSFSFEPTSENKPIDYNLLIKDKPVEINGDSEGFSKNVLFDKGSLKVLNSSLNLSNKSSITFVNNRGSVELDNALLKVSSIMNANIKLKQGATLHLYNKTPLRTSVVNVSGENVSVFFHDINSDAIINNVIKRGRISINDSTIYSKENLDKFNFWMISYKEGTVLTNRKTPF